VPCFGLPHLVRVQVGDLDVALAVVEHVEARLLSPTALFRYTRDRMHILPWAPKLSTTSGMDANGTSRTNNT
jgi:hypothetical protein